MHHSSPISSISLNFSLLFLCGDSFFSSAMAGMAALEALTDRLYGFIQSMEDEGIVDYHFEECYNMKEANGSVLFTEIIPTYISDSESTLVHMTNVLDQPIVDYNQLEQLCIKLKGGTTCIGACRMAASCGVFCQTTAARSKEDCMLMLEVIKGDFFTLRNKLETLLELEKRIVTNDYQGS
ncbi:unnamed protein product [Dovyalis caffra]|uniref:Histidine-containing phosphotransfer protein n=1 Tax=Dovyalis caffra TaxID=77055 RepID=A0AAV1QWW3_9ROSI|nr:unnamed protein product [Dovyalis caffra]